MIRIVFIFIFISFGFNGLHAQKELSKKEIRKLKKQEKIKSLAASLNSSSFKFVAKTMSSSFGKSTGARGGLMFIDGDKGKFMEFLTLDNNDKTIVNTLEFSLKDYSCTGSFKGGAMEVSFTATIKSHLWRFKLSIEKLGQSHLKLKGRNGIQIYYEGRTSKL